jgi:putative transposase
MKLGRVERIEFEYIRHGVVALIANWHIAKGQIITPTVGTTRTEDDFFEHINKTIETDPEAGWIFLVDQLNIHQSESLVRLVAQRCSIHIDLGVKGQSGILFLIGNTSCFFIRSESPHSLCLHSQAYFLAQSD